MKTTFSFGRNWLDFVNHSLDDRKMEIAFHSLLKYLPAEEYRGKVFIDVGCGSGIFSLSALRLGCKEVISFDYDEYSVLATETVKKKYSSLIPRNADWDIFQGSILDNDIIGRLEGKGDIVYSWGVLHHTGSMYQAINNATKLVKPNGYFIISIYNKAPYSDLWVKIKKFYNVSPVLLKRTYVRTMLLWLHVERVLLKARAIIKNQPQPDFHKGDDFRGMDLYYNMIDWLGGYPYEYASFEEIKDLVEKKGFELVNAPVKWPSPSKGHYKKTVSFFGRFFYSYFSNYTGTNEFVFRKLQGTAND